MYAQIAAEYITAWCVSRFKDVPESMASTMANGGMIDVFDHCGGGSHKYIPADKLSVDLGLQPGAGVYGYWRMADESYLLRTCDGRLAYWSGNEVDTAQWATLPTEKI